MSTNNDRVGPSGNQLGDIANKNGFTENGTVQDVTDGTVGRLPHLLKLEFWYCRKKKLDDQ
jgi:hypothetical protein